MRLAFQGYAAPLTGPVPAGNRNWIDSRLAPVAYSPEKARQILKGAHFRWNSAGRLLSPSGQPVEFTIAVSSTSAERIRMATLIQDDLSKIGMKVEVATVEFRSLLDRCRIVAKAGARVRWVNSSRLCHQSSADRTAERHRGLGWLLRRGTGRRSTAWPGPSIPSSSPVTRCRRPDSAHVLY